MEKESVLQQQQDGKISAHGLRTQLASVAAQADVILNPAGAKRVKIGTVSDGSSFTPVKPPSGYCICKGNSNACRKHLLQLVRIRCNVTVAEVLERPLFPNTSKNRCLNWLIRRKERTMLCSNRS